MKKIILSIIMVSMLISCKEDNKSNSSINKTEKEQNASATSKKKTPTKQKVENTTAGTTKGNLSESLLERAILDFQSCKSISKKRSDCRNQISKFISDTYHINDFKDKNNNDLIYDSIQPIVKKSKSWKNLGAATNQQHIDKAVNHASNGGLALVIDTSQSYGHVVIIQKGTTINSSSWGIKLPNVFSLSNYKPSKSFHNKALSYAFKKSDDLQIYIRQ